MEHVNGKYIVLDMLGKSIFIIVILVFVEDSKTQCLEKAYPSVEDVTAESSDGDYSQDAVDLERSVESNERLQDRNDDATRPKTCDNKFTSGTTGFSSKGKSYLTESNGRPLETNCRRAPERRKELLISGAVFRELCKYFGPRARDEMISGLDDELVLRRCSVGGERPGGYESARVYTMAFELQKPVLASCFRIAFDYYSNHSAKLYSAHPQSRYPACLQRLVIHPEPDFQIVWLNSFPQLFKYFHEVMRGQRIVTIAKGILESHLNDGLMDNWMELKDLAWAKATIRAWKNSRIRDTSKRLKKILERSPSFLDICNPSKTIPNAFGDPQSDLCLNKIAANLAMVEFFLQEDSTTLEYEFIGGKPLFLNLLYAVKSVLAKRRTPADIRRHETNLEVLAKGEIYDLRMANVRCADELRAILETSPFEKWIGSNHLHTCLKIFSVKIAKLMQTGVNMVGPDILQCNRAREWRKTENNLMKAVMTSYRKSKFLISLIHWEIEGGLLDAPLSDYPWAQQFIAKWRSSSIIEHKDRLENIYHSINAPPVDRACPRYEKNSDIMEDECWRRYIAETILVEAELMKSGLSLQLIFLGDPFLMNLIYFIDEALRGNGQLRNPDYDEPNGEAYPIRSSNGHIGRLRDEGVTEPAITSNGNRAESSSTATTNTHPESPGSTTSKKTTPPLIGKNSTNN